MSESLYPLQGLAEPGRARLVAGEAGIALAERRPSSLVEIACWPLQQETLRTQTWGALRLRSLPEPGKVIAARGLIVLSLSNGRFQVISDRTGLADDLEEMVSADVGAIVDLSQARAGVRVSGSRAQDLLQKGLDFDLNLQAFPALWAAQGAIHHMPVTILRLEPETFDVFTFRGFAGSLWDWLTDAAIEYGWRAAPPVA